MSRKIFNKVILLSVMLFTAGSAFAQDGAYSGFSPYSVFAIGDIYSQGSAYNKGMGGVGIALRNKRFINYMNPASVTARDTLSFMADMSLLGSTRVMSQNDIHNLNNTLNVNDIVISFPIYKSSAMMLGISPYSTTGYTYGATYGDNSMIENTRGINYTSVGQGSIYQAFVAAGVTFWKRLSIGVEGKGYFGHIDKSNTLSFGKESFSSIESGSILTLSSISGKFGLQYEQPVGKGTIGLGATYNLSSKVSGYSTNYRYSIGAANTDSLKYRNDTLKYASTPVRFASEIGLGISFAYGDDWRVEADWLRSDWTGSGMTSTEGFAVTGARKFSATVADSYRLGFEFVPNRNDIRYYLKTCTYRVGAYYDKAYYLLDGNKVNSYGITLGMSLPVFRYYNAVTFAVDLGQRAAACTGMVKENYVNFTVGFNFFDYWFRKVQYE